LTGGRGNDVTIGEDGNDKLSGNFGSDQLYGGAGNDVLNGGVGADVMVGGTGNDVYTVDLVTDLVIEAADEGIDHVQSATISLDLANFANVENAALIGGMGLNLTGTATVNALTGNSGANTILGLGGNDRLSGLAGADHLDGGAGNDTLNGGAGTDQLTGGADTDVFMFTNALEAGTGALRDVITDFVHLTDKLDVSAFMHGGHFIGNLTFSPGQGPQINYTSGLLSADVDGNGSADFQLTLQGAPVLTAADILF
jgi:Ca2+-binding RTX toxin-like protein